MRMTISLIVIGSTQQILWATYPGDSDVKYQIYFKKFLYWSKNSCTCRVIKITHI